MGGIGTMSAEVLSPLPGLVATVHVKTGDAVASGDPVVTLQSMKMEIPITAESAGTIAEILVSEGDEIDTGAVIARFS
jgi:biotin carboxyl carrier protein